LPENSKTYGIQKGAERVLAPPLKLNEEISVPFRESPHAGTPANQILKHVGLIEK
jgi:hypothetical protein